MNYIIKIKNIIKYKKILINIFVKYIILQLKFHN